MSSGLGARRTRTRLRGRLWGLQPPPPLFTTSAWPFSGLPFMATCSRNSVGLFRTVKHASAMLDSRKGSSVTKSTRSLDTRANTRRSVSSSAQDGCRRARPSTLARAPPNSLTTNALSSESVAAMASRNSHHCLPGIARVNGLHLANTSRDSTSCKLNSGLPVSRGGSITPALAVASL